MILVYVAGPYRAKTVAGIRQNIERARTVAEAVWALGQACICPHLNTALMDGIVPDEVFLKGDLEILKHCNVVLTISGWEASAGAKDEVAFARNLDIPVLHSIEDLKLWLDSPRRLERRF